MAAFNSGGSSAVATSNDVTTILGPLDQAKLIEILSLRPTVAEVEQASVWLSGDSDVYGAAGPIKGKASHIVTILTADEEEER